MPYILLPRPGPIIILRSWPMIIVVLGSLGSKIFSGSVMPLRFSVGMSIRCSDDTVNTVCTNDNISVDLLAGVKSHDTLIAVDTRDLTSGTDIYRLSVGSLTGSSISESSL
ncbi:hypothetical protein HG530_012283 [Fusarium avenaceum]|nr:hypothetical protein HG530_012283 [Fusarium avenaceum]